MNRTERLIDNTQNPLARELLRAAEMDRAPSNTAAKVALALGLGSSAIIATAATSAAASSAFASGTGTAVSATAMSAGAVAAAPAAGAVVAAAPAAAGAVTALGMLKVMAAVSIACGTLSYGSVKLAVNVSEKSAVTQQVQKPKHAASKALPKGTDARSPAALPAQGEANLPAPPPPPNSDDDVTAAREPEQRPLTVTAAASVSETNAPAVGRHSIPTNDLERASNASRSAEGKAENTPQGASKPTPGAPAEPHTAAFPNEDAHSASAIASAVAAPVSNLEREVAQLDHARAALAAGQAAQALRELDQYRAQSPRGVLAAESVVLRVKALLALGQRAAAEVEASPWLLNAPQSRHAERLREILGASSGSQ